MGARLKAALSLSILNNSAYMQLYVIETTINKYCNMAFQSYLEPWLSRNLFSVIVEHQDTLPVSSVKQEHLLDRFWLWAHDVV